MNVDNNYDPYKAAYASMPSHASANKDIKQLYVDGHFCYVYKIGIVTNDLGIVRHLNLYNKGFLDSHPELIPNKKSDSPDEDKSIHDARLLIPTLSDFFKAHPLINPKTFLGDAAFDSIDIYKELLNGDYFGNHDDGTCKTFQSAYIPLNSRSKLSVKCECPINENGIPCCPKNPSLITILKLSERTENAPVKLPVPHPNVVLCFTSIQNKIYGLIPVHIVAQRKGITPTKSVPVLSVPSIILNIVSALQKEKHKTRKRSTLI